MPSPFPGMDPYLEDERLWPDFRHQLVTCLYQILLPGLADRYRARVGKRRYQVGSQAHDEETIEVCQRDDGRLVTLVDVVSPANKLTDEGREAYLTARQAAREQGANLVEIDLVRKGQPLLDYSREGLPHWDYAVTVTRVSQPDRFEIYTATLQKRLPRFRLPLASNDRDVVVDLQTAFTRCYDQGGFAGRIDYENDPAVPLSDEDRRTLAELLKDKRVLTHERIAVAAYYLWQNEGCQPGRADEYWRRAIEQLRQSRI